MNTDHTSIRPTEHAVLPGAMFGFYTYEVYRSDSESESVDFLNRITITERQYYVMVEFPGGRLGKDKVGIYKPSSTWRGDDWVANKYHPTGRSLWRHCPPEIA